MKAGPPAALSFFRRVERWREAIFSLHFVPLLLRSQVDAAERTCAGNVEQPRIDTCWVETMVARQHALILTDLELVGADTAALSI
jgi:hypothetical protein